MPVYVFLHVCASLCISPYVFACLSLHVWVSRSLCVGLCTSLCLSICLCVSFCLRLCVCTSVNLCMYVCVSVSASVYLSPCISPCMSASGISAPVCVQRPCLKPCLLCGDTGGAVITDFSLDSSAQSPSQCASSSHSSVTCHSSWC
uniref:Uncharacterized protein n=1 Tax=Gopherus evgoodei TaxID=1825980 RepID=A0A8C4WGJ5_9SAUR